jgi:hypothetical protein
MQQIYYWQADVTIKMVFGNSFFTIFLPIDKLESADILQNWWLLM